jgi:hypothetical protein
MIKKIGKFLCLVVMLLIPQTMFGQTLFHHTAETTPTCCSLNSQYQFTDDEPGVTRSTTVAKNGSWSLKHEVTTIKGASECSSQTPCPKVAKFFDAGTGLTGTNPQLTEWYASHWFYIPSAGTNGYETDSTGGNWQIFTNHSEFKCAAQGTIRCPVGAKIALGFNWYKGTRRWFLDIQNAQYNPRATTVDDTNFTAGYFNCSATCEQPADGGKPRRNIWVFTGESVPLDTWIYVEWHIVMSQTNGEVQLWVGKADTGTLTELVHFADANLNTLTMFDDSADKWSNNRALYFAGGNYLSNDHTAATYTLYTDDWRISTTRVGPTLPEFSTNIGSTPLAPTALTTKLQ